MKNSVKVYPANLLASLPQHDKFLVKQKLLDPTARFTTVKLVLKSCSTETEQGNTRCAESADYSSGTYIHSSTMHELNEVIRLCKLVIIVYTLQTLKQCCNIIMIIIIFEQLCNIKSSAAVTL